ncbi:MAG: peptidase S8/S53 domain-containing protein [Olpidium bornovanus]|uniref:Peptidase S8/S53 domain-containing protein n=1 Tax=Olpidium bornovanus TaxID=278681 RepID=A0A8H7ZM87_9FUNG|nr:MAG: peptidase S8/S53 domain-containing protein [Olpidium bornovanus]
MGPFYRLALGAVLAATLLAPLPAAASRRPISFAQGLGPAAEAPLVSSTNAEELEDRYIVVLKDAGTDGNAHHDWQETFVPDFTEQGREAREMVRASIEWNGIARSHINHIYTGSFRGYAGRFEPDVVERIRRSHEVAYVERDQVVHVDYLQRNAPWGLSRISHRAIGFGTFNKYPYDDRAGGNVTVYVVDTGINIGHVDFEGRARWGSTIPVGDDDRDGNGHGTHCAGTIAGKRYGVAKKASVVAVKVLRSNGSGTMSDVIKGVEYVGEKHSEEVRIAKSRGEKHRGSVANMSLGGGRSRTLDRVINAVRLALGHKPKKRRNKKRRPGR